MKCKFILVCKMLTVRRGSLSEKYFAFVTDQVEEEPESKSQAKLNDKDQSKKYVMGLINTKISDY